MTRCFVTPRRFPISTLGQPLREQVKDEAVPVSCARGGRGSDTQGVIRRLPACCNPSAVAAPCLYSRSSAGGDVRHGDELKVA